MIPSKLPIRFHKRTNLWSITLVSGSVVIRGTLHYILSLIRDLEDPNL